MSSHLTPRSWPCLLPGLAAAVLLLATAGPGSAAAGHGLQSTPDAGWGTDGPVYAVVVSGDTVVVGGDFDAAVAPDGTTVPRGNLAAYSLTSGDLLTGWRADTDGIVRALTTDGSDLWVGGEFTAVDGTDHRGVAQLALSNGDLDPTFTARLGGGAVRALALVGTRLAAGGGFTTVNRQSGHARLVQVDAQTGATDTSFTPTVDAEVRSLGFVPSTGRLLVGGRFTQVNGMARPGLVGVNATTGVLAGPAFTGAGTTFALDVNSSGTRVYAGMVNNAAVAFSTASGRRLWSVSADGDMQAVRYTGSRVIVGFHDGYQGSTTTKALSLDPTTGAVDPVWRPVVDSFYGVWAIASSSRAVVLGGTFSTVTGVDARRVARFLL